MDFLQRTEILLGEDNIKTLKKAHVAVFGVGGVGGYVVEGLVRAGIGNIDVIDNDVVSVSNINRQIIATTKTVGKSKVDVIKERILDINPECKVNGYKMFFLKENSNDLDFSKYDYIVDAVDTVSAKIELCVKAKEFNVPIISSMGTGNKLNGNAFIVDDIKNTSVCPLAKVMRKELKDRNIENVKVLYSKEQPIKPQKNSLDGGKNVGSISFVPSIAGLIIAGEVIKDLIECKNKR